MRKQSLLWIALGLIMSLALVAAVAAQEATPNATPELEMVDRAVIGISVSDEDGVVTVQQVATGSGAEAAGLEVGDVITAINGDEVTSGSVLAETVTGLAIGDTVTLTIERDGESQDIDVTLGAASEIQMQPSGRGPRMFMQQPGELGLNYDAENGTLTITELSEDNPLYTAGLRADDVITAVDGEALDPMALFEYIAGLGPDGTVTLTVERDGESQDIEIPVADLASLGMSMMFENMPGGMMPGNRGNRDERGQMIPNMPMMPGGMMMGGNGRLGITFVTLDEQVASENGVEQTEGALVASVIEGSPAAVAGLQENDVITAVNGEPVDAERTLRDRLIAYEPGDTVTLDVIRGGETQQLEVTLGQPEMGEFMPFGGMFGGDGNGSFRFFTPDGVLPPGHPPIDGSEDSGSNTSSRPNV
jgi:S1-C subfamily serine protease